MVKDERGPLEIAAARVIEEDEADFERCFTRIMQQIGHLPLSEQLSIVAGALEAMLAHHEELSRPEAGLEAIAEARRLERDCRSRGA